MNIPNNKSEGVQRSVIDRDKLVLQCIVPVHEISPSNTLNIAPFTKRRIELSIEDSRSLICKWTAFVSRLELALLLFPRGRHSCVLGGTAAVPLQVASKEHFKTR